MTDQLRNVLRHISDFSDAELNTIVACFRPGSVKKNMILLREGQVCKAFYFIVRGCIRVYFITKDGQEKTRYIMPDNYLGTALTSFIAKEKSFEYIEALEDTELLTISHSDFYRLNDQYISWKVFYQKILEMAYSFQNKKIESLVTMTAKQRYEQLLQSNPGLVQRVSNKVLASYLDMAQETLSRLKPR